MSTGTQEIFCNNFEAHRYELHIGDHIVFAEYRREGSILYIPHVEAPPVLRGTGAAGRLMAALVAEARREHLKIVPICSYAAAWIDRHAEHRDVPA